MPQIRIDETTKSKLPLARKEFLINNPKFEGMKLSENFIMNRALDWYLKGSRFEPEKTEE